MKLFATIKVALLSLGVSIAAGSGVAEGDPQDEEHSLRQLRLKPRTYDCDEGCDLDEDSPVCGVDGSTYANECLAMCQDVAIKRRGDCASDPLAKAASRGKKQRKKRGTVARGKVTRAEMDAYKDKKYKLVAKRTFGGTPSRDNGREGTAAVHESEENKDIGLPRDNENKDTPSSLKITMITSDGLEYEAEFSEDEIPEGVETEGSGGDIPPMPGAIDGNKEEEQDSNGRSLSSTLEQIIHPTGDVTNKNWRIGEIDYLEEDCRGWWPFRKCETYFDGRCTGSIVGKNKILTAAHCIWDRKNEKVYNIFHGRFAPGRTDSTYHSHPWGTWEIIDAVFYSYFREYSEAESKAWDVGVLTVKPQDGTGGRTDYGNGEIGDYMGTFGLQKQPNSFIESQWSFTGYPSEIHTDHTMWNTGVCSDWHYGPGAPIILHKCSSWGGMSGAGIRNTRGPDVARDKIHGVHTLGYRPDCKEHQSGCWNSGVAINSRHLRNIEHMIAE